VCMCAYAYTSGQTYQNPDGRSIPVGLGDELRSLVCMCAYAYITGQIHQNEMVGLSPCRFGG
jgi:hypothetical protein